jgi:glutaminase
MSENNLQRLLRRAQEEAIKGKLPSYIPLLAQVDRQAIAIAIYQVNKEFQGDYQLNKLNMALAGHTSLKFPLMSVIKPFLLLYLLETMGIDEVFRIVDRQPTLDEFNAIPEGKPQNPMINSGAIAISSRLPSYKILQNWLNEQSGAELSLDYEMLDSVRSNANRRNLAIAAQLQSLGIITDPDRALRAYEEICCLRGNVQDLAKIGALLIDATSSHNAIVLEIMTKCGMYGASAEFAQDIGLPSKSSVSGAILSIVPHQVAIACYSPALDAIGNSVAGIFLIRQVKSMI